MKGKTKTQKGITLIALIITIVVLLILAVVTINAIQNDGIIAYADNSTKQYEAKSEEENTILQSYLNKLEENDPVIKKLKEEQEELELMKKYVLGEEKTGQLVTNVVNLDTSTMQVTSFVNDEETIKDASTTITPLFTAFGEDNTIAHAYARYNNKVYKIVADFTTYMTESVEVVYKPEGREGQKVKYDSDGKDGAEDWIILTDRNNTLEIVSANVMGDLKLGSWDEEIKGNLVQYLDLNKDGIVDDKDDLDGDEKIKEDGNDDEIDYHDIAIASYNNAISTINKYCKNLVTAETDKSKVRSIGASAETTGEYTSPNFNNWFANSENVRGKKGDTEFETDLAKLYYHRLANTGTEYWVASRLVYEDSGYVDFCGRRVDSDGIFDYNLLWGVDSDGDVYYYDPSYGVRPVVINPSNIQYP